MATAAAAARLDGNLAVHVILRGMREMISYGSSVLHGRGLQAGETESKGSQVGRGQIAVDRCSMDIARRNGRGQRGVIDFRVEIKL